MAMSRGIQAIGGRPKSTLPVAMAHWMNTLVASAKMPSTMWPANMLP